MMPRVNALPPYLGPLRRLLRGSHPPRPRTPAKRISNLPVGRARPAGIAYGHRGHLFISTDANLVENRTRAEQLLLTIGEIVGGEDARLRWPIRSQAHGASSPAR